MPSNEELLWDNINEPEKVVHFLEQKANANYVVPSGRWQGWTPLAYAVYKGKSQCVTLLLTYGANPNQVFKQNTDSCWIGWPLLAYAICQLEDAYQSMMGKKLLPLSSHDIHSNYRFMMKA